MNNCTESDRRKRNFGIQYPQRIVPGFLSLALVLLGLFTVGITAVDPAFGRNSMQSDGELMEDFQFSAPKVFLGFRIGRFFPKAQSDLWDMITDELTLEKNDFRAWDLGFDGGLALHKRVDVVFSLEYLQRSKNSEFREWVDDQGLPITQETYYSQLPLTAGVKILLIPRGRSVGRYAWVPSRIVPYVGAGFGTLWYRFGQSGDFVDYDTLDIFSANLESSGWTVTAYAGGGVDINIAKYTYVTVDLRYSWASPELNQDFVGFDPLDLDGIRVTAGLQWHF